MALRPWVVWSGVCSRIDASVATSSVRARIKLVGDVTVAPGRKRLSDTPANQVGRPIDLTMTPDEADKLADELRRQAAAARAGVEVDESPAPVPADIRERVSWRFGDWRNGPPGSLTHGPLTPEVAARVERMNSARAVADDEVPV